MSLTIPPPHKTVFKNGIKHPALYLWDAWSYYENNTIHLYCLALNRMKEDGTRLDPSDRNAFPFHMRHFTSKDEGQTWTDEGCFLKPRLGEDRHDSKTIWSGSVEPLQNGKKLVAYTGLSGVDSNRIFIQNIALAISEDGYNIDHVADTALSSPEGDWTSISETGYFMDQLDRIGHKDGENGGPILAWRDPFIFIDNEEGIHLFWAAKISSHTPAMAHALVERHGDNFEMTQLFAPIVVPDGNEFTQLELPKILFAVKTKVYYLLISTCNRLFEGQPDEDVEKKVRLYKSDALTGPWEPYGIKGSVILESENLFGLTVLKTDFKNNRLLCIAPYTDAAENHLSLTFSVPFYINLDPVAVIF